jgi:hypothetical protein
MSSREHDYNYPFSADDEIQSEQDLSRHHFLTGWELERLKARCYAGGFACCTGIFIAGIALLWLVLWLTGR